jgi:hypothetical protein
VIRFVEQAGYRSLATSQPRANTPGTNHFSLGRVAILRDVPDAKFREICAGSALSKLRFLESVRQGAKSLMGNSIYDFLRNRFLGQK